LSVMLGVWPLAGPCATPRGRRHASLMLFLVIERFKDADPKPISERFERSGRTLSDGLTYHASWVDVEGQPLFSG
jgi:hypothetical protein